jgi:hypothetical protein
MATQRFDGDVEITGAIRVSGTYTGPINRSNLIADNTAAYMLPFQNFQVWDAFGTALANGAGSNDDLGLTAGAFGTGLPYVETRDLTGNAGAGVAHYARTTFTLPPEYLSGGTITLQLAAGMKGVVAATSAVADAEAYLSARTTLVSGSDLVSTAAQNINSVTFADYLFSLTPTGRVAGDVLDIRLSLTATSATVASHFAAITHAEMVLQVKG